MAEADACDDGATAALTDGLLARHAATRGKLAAGDSDLLAAALVSACLGTRDPDARRLQRVAAATTLGGTIRAPGEPSGWDPLTAALLTAARARQGGLQASNPALGPVPAEACAAAAWCAGLQVGASWPEIVSAFAAGLEAQIRLTEVLRAMPGGQVWDLPALTSVIGAAGAAGLLAGLSAGRLAQAIGIAASQTVGTPLMADTPAGMMHAARPAANGLLAARLAAAGYTGPCRVLEAHRGLFLVLVQALPPAHRFAEARPGPVRVTRPAPMDRTAPVPARLQGIAALRRLAAQLALLDGSAPAQAAVLQRIEGTAPWQ